MVTATPSFPLTCNGTDLEGTVRKMARRWQGKEGGTEFDTSQVCSEATEANSGAVRQAFESACR